MLHLRYFIAVAEELNFTRAATRLRLSPPPLSQRIKDLERQLGRELFIRSHHRVELTDAGQTLLPVAREIIQRFDAVSALVHESTGTRSHTVVLGIAPEVSVQLRTTVLGALAAHPDIAVRLHPAEGGRLLRSLHAGELDLALVTEPAAVHGIGSVRLECQPVGVVVASGIGFDGRACVRLEELAHLPYAPMGFDAGPMLLKSVEYTLRSIGAQRCSMIDASSPGGVAHVVATGQAFTIVGRCSGSKKVFADEQVLVLPLEGIDATVTTVAAWREDRVRDGGPLVGPVRTLRSLAAHRVPPESVDQNEPSRAVSKGSG
ncbi:LysR family transcriptional regulator [Nocardia callitridis]|uniref:LysR family transcriptional regulator n=1 Tax=Nocardia callitridis TaxID=648753 RepID=A0ABP9KXA9_9NOCA